MTSQQRSDKFKKKKKTISDFHKKNVGKMSLSLYCECSQIRRRALTASGLDIFILLEPSDSCLHSHFILHATTKKKREKKIKLIKCGGGRRKNGRWSCVVEWMGCNIPPSCAVNQKGWVNK